MPGPYGPITVEGSRSRATECDQQHVKIVDSTCAKEYLTTYKEKVDPADSTILNRLLITTPSSNRLKTQRKLTLSLVILPNSSSSGPGYLINRKACSSRSFVRIGTSLHGNLPTCRVSRENSLRTT